MVTTAVRRIATYERVSSEDQRDRETIRTQQDELAKRLATDPTGQLVKRYSDDGISGTIPMGERPAGRDLLRDAEAHLYDELWAYNIKRLGREAVDLLTLRRRFESLGIRLISLLEGEQTGLSYDVHAIVADYDRRNFLKVSADGMNRAAREGRYTGGIVPLGYKVVGRKQTAHLEPSDEPMWGGLSEAEVVRRIYAHLTVDGWSCVKIAQEFNRLGIPTDYVHDNREVARKGQRKQRTQGVWRPGRIRNMVVNPVYKGAVKFGRRSTRPGGREVITAKVPALVSEGIWNAAQGTLRRNRIAGPSSKQVYLLKSVMRCGICGLTYASSWNRNSVWYRCNGHLTGRGPLEGRCPAKDVKGERIEPTVWADIEGFLRNPGEILDALAHERDDDSAAAVQEAQRLTLEDALQQLSLRRKNAIDLRTRDRITDEEFDGQLLEIDKEKAAVEEHLAALIVDVEQEWPEPITEDLLTGLRQRIDAGLTPQQKQEIVRLLVKKITIYTEGEGKGRDARAVIEYRFTPPSVEVRTPTGIRGEKNCTNVRRVLVLPSGRWPGRGA